LIEARLKMQIKLSLEIRQVYITILGYNNGRKFWIIVGLILMNLWGTSCCKFVTNKQAIADPSNLFSSIIIIFTSWRICWFPIYSLPAIFLLSRGLTRNFEGLPRIGTQKILMDIPSEAVAHCTRLSRINTMTWPRCTGSRRSIPESVAQSSARPFSFHNFGFYWKLQCNTTV